MRVKSARLEGLTLTLELSDLGSRREAGRFLDGFQEGDYELKRKRKRRSLDANGYFWELVSELAEVTGEPKTEIYQRAVREIGGNSTTVCCRDKAVDGLRRGWASNGLGWVSETYKSKIRGCTNVVLYYGSSTYDTKTMSRLIDYVIQDCKALGIETLPPDQLEGLMHEERDQKNSDPSQG